jgi:hypothetical protein
MMLSQPVTKFHAGESQIVTNNETQFLFHFQVITVEQTYQLENPYHLFHFNLLDTSGYFTVTCTLLDIDIDIALLLIHCH